MLLWYLHSHTELEVNIHVVYCVALDYSNGCPYAEISISKDVKRLYEKPAYSLDDFVTP